MRRLLTLLLALVICAGEANAAGVYVTTATEEFGHAWLFGSRNSSSEHCWLALPRHVVESFDGNALLPVRFRGRTGDWGESAMPIAVGDVPGAAEAAGDTDLVFAEVMIGPRPGQCLDRLGLPPVAYDSALDRRDPMFVRSMLPQSFGEFVVSVQAGATGDRAGILRVRPDAGTDAATYMKRGISGGVAMISRPTGAEPLAMILRVEEDQGTALSLRFDRIRAAFDIVEDAVLATRRQAIAETDGVRYKIVSYSGIAAGSAAAAVLAEEDGCWKVAPEGGKRTVHIVVELKDAKSSVRGLTVSQSATCGSAPTEVYVDQRVSDNADWARAVQCETAAEAGAMPACRIDLRGPRQFRIAIAARGQIGISRLRLY